MVVHQSGGEVDEDAEGCEGRDRLRCRDQHGFEEVAALGAVLLLLLGGRRDRVSWSDARIALRLGRRSSCRHFIKATAADQLYPDDTLLHAFGFTHYSDTSYVYSSSSCDLWVDLPPVYMYIVYLFGFGLLRFAFGFIFSALAPVEDVDP